MDDNMDEDSDFVPDTPSPILQKKRMKSSASQEPRYNRVLKDNNFSNGFVDREEESGSCYKGPLSLPGQNGFAEEREEAIRRKKKKEHLSPFKTRFGSADSKFHSPCAQPKTNLLGGFVKSSSLLKTNTGDSVGVGSIPSARNGHRIHTKRKSATSVGVSEKRTKQRKTNVIAWPSSSDSSSDEDDLLDRHRIKLSSVGDGHKGRCKCSKSVTDRTICSTAADCTTCHRHASSSNKGQHSKSRNTSKQNASHQFKSKTKSSTVSRCPDTKSNDETPSKKRVPKSPLSTPESPLLAPWHNYMESEPALSPSPKRRLSSSIDTRPRHFTSATATSSARFPISSSSDTDIDLDLGSPVLMSGGSLGDSGRGRQARGRGRRDSGRDRGSGHTTHRGSVVAADRTTPTSDIICLTPEASPGAGSRTCPIDVELLTPGTRQAVTHVRQMQSDEEIARKLQEELDHEFAMTLQHQSENMNPPPTFNPSPHLGLEDQEEEEERYYTPRLHYSPPTTRRRRGRGAPGIARVSSRSNRISDELMELMGPSGADLLLAMSAMDGFGGDGPRRRGGRGAVPPFMGGMMFSPSATGNDYEMLMDLSERIGDAVPKGLSKSQAGQLPTVTYKKQPGREEECNICMTEYDDGDSQKILPCFHTYHAACINKWIVKNATCPVCRVPVKLE